MLVVALNLKARSDRGAHNRDARNLEYGIVETANEENVSIFLSLNSKIVKIMQVTVGFVIIFIHRWKIHFVHFLRLLQHRYYWCCLCCSSVCVYIYILHHLSVSFFFLFILDWRRNRRRFHSTCVLPTLAFK